MCRCVDHELSSGERSIQMLKQILNGATYAGVGRDFGVTRTAVERRIKEVARHLIRTVGIEGLTDEGATFVRRLRANRSAILGALVAFNPEWRTGQARKRGELRVYSERDVLAAAERIRADSNQSQRDLALFLLLFATGIRPLEAARLRVRDYLQADGKVREVSELPAEAAINGVARPLYFASQRLNGTLLPYLLDRTRGSGIDDARPYFGLDPDQPLFLAANGKGFAITAYTHEGHRRYLCRPILEAYRKIFRYAGLPGGTPLAVRTTVAARLYARGAEDEQVGLVLGISHRSSVRQRFPRAKPTLLQLVEEQV